MPPRAYFDESSLLREVVGHRLTGLSGPRALLVMAAHPVAFAGFFAHTGALGGVRPRVRDDSISARATRQHINRVRTYMELS